jgi:demethylmacrocin O-methyltransferase
MKAIDRIKKVKKQILNPINEIRAKNVADDLDKLGRIYGTDKIDTHFYTPHYSLHFEKFRDKPVRLLEIGVGGYEKPFSGAKSLRMWKHYFPSGNIYSIDIYDKSALQEERIRIFQGSQVDRAFLDKVCEETGELDIIIDDGSHINEHVIETFKILFPKLKDGGIYVIEDTNTSYWPEYGGDSSNLNNPLTSMNFFKKLTDCLNHKEFLIPGYQPDYFDQHIVAMHFYHNIIFIYKGSNDEPSSMPRSHRNMLEKGNS